MADIPVTKKSHSWWIWLIVLLVLAAIIWWVWGMSNQPQPTATTPAVAEPTTTAAAPAAGVTTPATPQVPTEAPVAAVPATAAPAAGEPITDAAAYAAAADKLALIGRRVELADARVVRVVGPKTFTVASGTEEMYVMVGSGLDMGVGTQGQINQGSVLNVQGSFQRLSAEEISDISSNRFRDLTEQERETLRNRQVYLEATAIRKVS